jgi:hypothetical protein
MQIACSRAKAWLVAIIFLSFACLSAHAQTIIHVPADSPSIQDALFSANDGDTVLVSPGRYFGGIVFPDKNITLASSDGPTVTIIDSAGGSTGVSFNFLQSQRIVLRGFTITNGFPFNGGGGILIQGSSPTIDGNIITANQGCGGGGIAALQSSAIIRNNVISNNISANCFPPQGGGGVRIVGTGNVQLLNNTITGNQQQDGGDGGGVMTDQFANVLISGNIIQGNSAGGNGGGVVIGSSPVLLNNVITGNTASQGGGVYAFANQGQPAFVNNTIAGNSAAVGTQLYIDAADGNVEIANNLLIDFTGSGAVFCGSTAGQIPVFNHNDVFSVQSSSGAPAPAYTGACPDSTGTNGNLQADPNFVDQISGNFHLQPGSVALDAGDNLAANLPATDVEGNPRLAASNSVTCSGIVDLGAYEMVAATNGTAFLNPNSVLFGTQFMGSPSSPQPLTVFATSGCVQIASIQTTGDFQQTNNCGAMSSGASCTIQVAFNPTAPGLRNGTLTVNTATPGATPLTASLSGQGQNSGSVSPTTLNFGNQLVGQPSASQFVNVFSSFSLPPMQLTSPIAITGEFSQTNNCVALSFSFIPNPCTVTVIFTPVGAGLKSGTLTISTTQGLYIVPLSGNGSTAVPSLSPATLNFASQIIGTTSPAQTITLTNDGTADLEVQSLTTSAGFIVQPETCFGSLAPGVSCTYSAVFAPFTIGDAAGTFTLQTNGGTASVALSGTGTQPIVSLSPQVLNFIAPPAGTASGSQTVTVTNVSGVQVQITSISATNNFFATSACPSALDLNASCTIDVILAPNSPGPYAGVLTLATNLGNVDAVLTSSDGHQTLRVPADFPGIGAAILAAQNGDTVLVSPGTYFEQVSFQGKAITVASESGPAVTVLDGQGLTPVLMSSNETAQSVLRGFTITHGNGNGISLFGASPTIEENIITANSGCNNVTGVLSFFASPTIRHNTITNNVDLCGFSSQGGGILINGNAGSANAPIARTQILNNTITGNQTSSQGGGGIAITGGGNALIQSNTIESNSTTGNGGGIYIENGSTADIVQNLIDNNTAAVGGGIHQTLASFFPGSLMLNNTVANNSAGSGAEVFIDGQDGNIAFTNNLLIDSSTAGAIFCGLSSGQVPTFLRNDVFSQGGAAYSGACQDGGPGNFGNINVDPQFASPANGNFHLQTTSPAIDAGLNANGLPDVDLDGNGRIGPGNAGTCVGSADLGVYEAQLFATGTVFVQTSADLGSTPLGSNFNNVFIPVSVSGCVQLSSAKTTGDFQQTNVCTTGLSNSSSCSIQVTFIPTAAGLRKGSLTLNFGSTSPAKTVDLTGNAFLLSLPSSPSSVVFADQPVQTSSVSLPVTILGIMPQPLLVNGVWVSGDFSQTNNCVFPSLAGAECIVNLVFTPTLGGLRTGTLTVSTNQGIAVVPLTGNGISSLTATLTPASIVFPDQLVGATSAGQFATLKNTGSASFTPGAFTISGAFGVDASQCQLAIAPGTSCNYKFTFSPAAIGPSNGVFAVQTPAGNFSVNLSGNGATPQASVGPQALTFANQALNTTSAAQAITLTNSGTVPVNLLAFSINGDFARVVSCPATLLPGNSCTIGVTFTPTALGNRTGTLGIGTAAGNFLIPLSGTGVNALASISATALPFGSEFLNTTTSARNIVLTAGVNPLLISSIVASGDFAQTSNCAGTLDSGASCSIQLTFTPTSDGIRTGVLTVVTNEATFSAQLSGQLLTRAANTIYVPNDQPAIQSGIVAAVNGETVVVLPGTYSEHIDFLGKAITVTTSDGTALTTIDGTLSGTVVTFKTGEGNSSVLKGFTITNGRSTLQGAGIEVGSTSPTIQNNVITANQGCGGAGINVASGSPVIQKNTISQNLESTCSGGEGVGISVIGGSPQILNNSITDNNNPNGGDGGGIGINAGSPTIIGNIIQRNSVFNDGGGISIINQSTATIIDNLITENHSTGNGGGIYISVPSGSRGPLVLNNTIANNTASKGSAAFVDGFVSTTQLINNIFIGSAGSVALDCSGVFSTAPPVLISNNAFSSGAAGYGETCASAPGTNGNVSVDPQFAAATAGNYRLQTTSPLIDAGTNEPALPALDLDGNQRVSSGSAATCNSTVDLGAYELILSSTPSATLAPASLDFGLQPVGSTSPSQSFTIQATQGCVAVSGITVTGDFIQSNNCPAVLGTGASCTAQVTFTPSASGLRTGTFALNASGATLSAGLTGQGAVPAAGFSPAAWNFGSQRVQTQSAAQTIVLTSSGNVPLQITGISITGPFAESNNCPATLVSGATCFINVTFLPVARGTANGVLTLASNSTSAVNTVALTGTGVAPVAVLTSSLAFGAQNVKTTSSQTATLTNTGDAALNISSISATGNFAVTNFCPVTLAPATSCSIQVTFTPTVAGAISGVLGVSDDDPVAGQQTSALSGTGLDYSISSSPASVTVKAGNTAIYSIAVKALGGNFATPVSLACGGLPVGATCTLTPASVVPGSTSASASLSVATSNGSHGTKKTPAGTYTITVNGIAGALSHSVTLTLVVQ